MTLAGQKRTSRAATGAGKRPNGWWPRIASYFRFIHNRRPDTAHPVVPVSFWAWLLAAMIVSGALVRFVDPGYRAALGSLSGTWVEAFEYVTLVGDSEWILYSTGAALVLFSFVTADRFRGHSHLVWHRLFLTAYFLFTAVAFAGLIANLFKQIFGRARPRFLEGSGVWESIPFTGNYHHASFPSGHATTAGALAMAFALLFPRFRAAFLVGGVFVALSRPMLGVHFPSDIVAGLALGAGFSWIWARSFARKRLLFTFTDAGGLQLRGEGRGRMGLAFAIMTGSAPRQRAGRRQ